MILDTRFFFRVLVFPGFLFLFSFTLFCDWFERKVMARMQNRMGPSYAGPFGILQPFADWVKLLTKEDIVPEGAGGLALAIAPIISFSLLVLSMLYFPLDGANAFSNEGFEGDLLLVLALVTFANFLLFLLGWSSSNPYSGIGAVRIMTQFVGYDIPLTILSLGPAFLAGSLSLSRIASVQKVPFALVIPWVFAFFLLALQAELEEDPFDTPHAETEIAAGYWTELTGRKLAFVRFSEDLQVVFGAVLAADLFLGGPYGPAFELGHGLPIVWFVLKALFIIFMLEFVEAVCARLRIDQVVRTNWKLMVPLSLLSLALVTFCIPFVQSATGGA
ncbi:MAG: NADH-quinone oxidoreductase subunit H [Candidatus Brockarchaeota archaeon]|nr:NADH-quinone oxidoreductase subunit H [Candidatus Brockarchaeota archaeon]